MFVTTTSCVTVAVLETVVLGVKVDVMVGAGPSMHKQAVLTTALAPERRLLKIDALASGVLV